MAKIGDVGLAKVIRNSALKLPIGTLHFTAPEAVSIPQYSKPVDVFSLGCIACHVMSHEWPKPIDSEDSLPVHTEAQKREPYLQVCTQSSLKDLIKSCLCNEPSQRPRVSAARIKLEHLKTITTDQFPLAAANHIELLDVVELEKLQVGRLRSDLEDARTTETVIEQMKELIVQKIRNCSRWSNEIPPQGRRYVVILCALFWEGHC